MYRALPPLPARTGPLAAVLGAMGLLLALARVAHAAPASEQEPIGAIIERLGLHEAPAPVHERPGWRVPPRILLLGFERKTLAERDRLAGAVPTAQLEVAHDRAEALRLAPSADVLIGFNPQICDDAIIDAARQLRWILSLAAGVDHCVTVPSVRARHLLITNMRGVDSAPIAEHALALALALAHGLDIYVKDTEQARWLKSPASIAHMEMLSGKTLLVVGLGGIGTDLARQAHGIGMKVIATRERGHTGPDFVSYVGGPDELLKLAREADVIAMTAPLTRETRGLFDARFFAVLKPTAIFINVARGPSVVTADLERALTEHRLGGAGLDVADPEPLPPDNPLWHAPHVIITPHVSYVGLPSDARWRLAAENLRRYAAGERMLSVVDLSLGY